MKKLENKNTTTMLKQNRSELKRHYTISVVPKGKGFQSRVTLKIIGGGKNPRITAYSGISSSDAVCKILLKMAERLTEYKKMNLLKKEICLNVYDSIMISIQELKLTSNSNVMKSATTVFQILTITDNEIITPVNYSYVDATPNIEQPVYQNNVFQKQTSETENQNKIKFFEQNQIAPVKSKSFETVALEWFRYKLSLTEKTVQTI